MADRTLPPSVCFILPSGVRCEGPAPRVAGRAVPADPAVEGVFTVTFAVSPWTPSRIGSTALSFAHPAQATASVAAHASRMITVFPFRANTPWQDPLTLAAAAFAVNASNQRLHDVQNGALRMNSP